MHAVHMCKCQGPGSDNKSSWIRVKEQWEVKNAGGLKVKALGETPRDVGLSPTWHSKLFLLYIFA